MKAIKPPRITSRSQLIHRIRHELERRGYPRVQMLLLVALTGGAGFLASVALLGFGVDSMALRYVLAVGIAYLVFLLLLWLWLRTSPEDYEGFDGAILEIVDAIPTTPSRAAGRMMTGEGRFGGGSGRWDEGARSEPLVELPDIPVPSIDAAADADEYAIPLAAILIVATIALIVMLASASVVLTAPTLFVELIVDGALAGTLYRRLRRVEPRHWLQSAILRTIVPFAITAVLLGVGGWGLSVYAPGARTLGEAVRNVPLDPEYGAR